MVGSTLTDEDKEGIDNGTKPDTTDRDDKTLWCACDEKAGDECSSSCTF